MLKNFKLSTLKSFYYYRLFVNYEVTVNEKSISQQCCRYMSMYKAYSYDTQGYFVSLNTTILQDYIKKNMHLNNYS